jgi:hypothetical protein
MSSRDFLVPSVRAATPGARLQRKCACAEEGTTCARCAGEMRRKASAAAPASIPPIVDSVLASPGAPIDAGTRNFMEARLGQDLSNVRVHADREAAQSSVAVNALAYTVRNDIVFAPGRYAPNTSEGRQLLAHELAHVAQQRSGVSGADETAAEAEADDVAGRIATGGAPKLLHGIGSGLHRKEPDEDERKKMQANVDACPADKCHPPPPAKKDWRDLGTPGDDAVRAWIMSPPPPPPPPAGNAHVTPPKDDPMKFKTPSKEDLARLYAYAKAAPEIEKREAAKKQEEMEKALALARQTGSMYLDPNLDRPAAERKLREQHAQLKIVAPELAEAFERDPGYMKAMGKYAESGTPDAAGIPAATPGVVAPFVFSFEGKHSVDMTAAYWQTPRGKARLALKQDIAVTRSALEALYGERRDIVDSSVVVRKVSESMVGIEPPPISKLNECRDLLDAADEKLMKDDLEEASRLANKASRLRREASWYWGRYKDFLFLGAERTVEGLEAVKTGSKYSLMVLSMAATGGAAAPLWIGTLGGVAIELTDAGTKAALGEKVDWGKVAADTALQIVLARFGGRFSTSLVAKLAKQPSFAGLEQSLIGGAIRGVINGMEARAATNALGSVMQGETWGKTLDNVINGFADWTLFVDMVLGAAHAAAARKSGKPDAKPAATKTEPAAKKPATGAPERKTLAAPEPIEGGHHTQITPDAIEVCSPGPCVNLRLVYDKELAQHESLRKEMDRVDTIRKIAARLEEQGKPDPALAKRASTAAAQLQKKLEKARLGQVEPDVPVTKGGDKRPGRPLPEGWADEALQKIDQPDAFEVHLGKKRAAAIAAGEKDFYLSHKVTLGDIDEPLAVGAGDITPQRAVDRALDKHNRQFLDPATNRQTKHLGTDPRDIERGRKTLEAVSLKDDPTALYTRRFDEIEEMSRIFDEAANGIRDKGKFSPTELKNEVNRRIRDIIKDGKSKDAQVVRDTLRDLGLEYREKVGWVHTGNAP